MTAVAVEEVLDDDGRAVIARLYSLYLHDLSEFTDHYALQRDGSWRPSYIEDWFTRDGTHSFLLRVRGDAAGFALVATPPFPFMARDADVRMAEFFVARPFRRRGVGAEAALTLLERFTGRWTVEQVERNTGATAFWRGVIDRHTGGRYEERTADGEVVQRFETA